MADPRVKSLVDALENFIVETHDYMTLNKIGDPEKQHSVKYGRAALAQLKETKK